MAKIVGGVTTSHIPAIGIAITSGRQNEPYWKPFFDGYIKVREWLDRVKPDIAVVIYNDHGLNFFLDTVPTFAIGAAAEYHNADEGWGLTTLRSFQGDPQFSWHLIESLVNDEFDMTICQEMLIDHGFIVPMQVMWGDRKEWPVTAVPLSVNVVQHPLPTAARCYKLGKALGRAIESYPEDKKVVIFGTGGMSHQLQGERSGYINKKDDMMYMEKIVRDPEALTHISNAEMMERFGTEGIELIMWLVMRGALHDKVNTIHKHYHIPVSNTAAGVLVLENAA
ncbi:MAG: protocatechuate 3,4-dioxygenase [Gammaproteobacteria bacterium]|nr:protocatechuate 3,4-dioxygenase [Gammaproteobacteria bacterium]